MRWALAFHPQQIKTMPNGRFKFLNHPREIPEDSADVAMAQGWIVIGRDSDVYPKKPDADVNVQSNPRRHADADDQC